MLWLNKPLPVNKQQPTRKKKGRTGRKFPLGPYFHELLRVDARAPAPVRLYKAGLVQGSSWLEKATGNQAYLVGYRFGPLELLSPPKRFRLLVLASRSPIWAPALMVFI